MADESNKNYENNYGDFLEFLYPFIALSVLSLFFFQAVIENIAYIYFVNLSAMSIDVSIVLLIFFLSPFLLLLGRFLPSEDLIYIISGISCVIFRISMFFVHSTLFLYILASGLTIASFMLFLPVVIRYQKSQTDQERMLTSELIAAIMVGFSISIISRIFGNSMDITLTFPFSIIIGGLGILVVIVLLLDMQVYGKTPSTQPRIEKAGNVLHIILSACGIAGIFFLFFTPICFPDVLSRWAELDYIVIAFGILVGILGGTLALQFTNDSPYLRPIIVITNIILLIWVIDFVFIHSPLIYITTIVATGTLILDLMIIFENNRRITLKQRGIIFGSGIFGFLIIDLLFVFSVTYGQIFMAFKGLEVILIPLAGILAVISGITECLVDKEVLIQ